MYEKMIISNVNSIKLLIRERYSINWALFFDHSLNRKILWFDLNNLCFFIYGRIGYLNYILADSILFSLFYHLRQPEIRLNISDFTCDIII